MTEKRKVLYTEKISIGSKIITFSIKEAENGSKYLQISELNIKNGEYKIQNNITLFKEQLIDFSKAFNTCFHEIVKFWNWDNRIKKTEQNLKSNPFSRTFAKWTEQEELKLKEKYTQDFTEDELSLLFERRPSCIKKRIKQLGLKKNNVKESYIEITRKKYHKAYEKWTEEEEQKLIHEYKNGRSKRELVEIFGRKTSAITTRLKKLGIIYVRRDMRS